MNNEALSPMVVAGDKQATKLNQVTIERDEDIERVNELLKDGWRLMSIGHRPNATVYVLGRIEEKQRHRPGFLGNE